MGELPKYQKRRDGYCVDYMPDDLHVVADDRLDLQITVGDMGLDDAFYATLSPTDVELTIGQVLEVVFPSDRRNATEVKARLDVRANPDLPDMYVALSDVFGAWRQGRCDLAIFANNGPQVGLKDRARDHLSVSTAPGVGGRRGLILDLVFEQTYTPFRYAVQRGYYAGEEQVLVWLQECALLYLLDGGGVEVSPDLESDPTGELLDVARRLKARQLVAFVEGQGSVEVTDDGRRLLDRLVQEAESQIDRFDLFHDVLFDAEDEWVTFGSGRGDDLRVPVYEAEGLDPVRAVFLLRLYDGTFLGRLSDDPKAIVDRRFLEETLTPVVDRPQLEESVLDWIIDSGYTRMEELEEQERDREARAAIMRQVETE